MLSGPISAQLEVTERCNYRCPHCYRLDEQTISQTPTELPDDQLLTLANKLIDSGIMSLILTGGEPLVRKDIVLELVRLASQRNVHCSMNTNMALMSETYLADLISAGIGNLLISCPSADPATYRLMTARGNLKRFWGKLDLVLASNIRYTINMVVNKTNLHQVTSTAQTLAQRGVDSFSATPAGFNPNAPDKESFLTSDEVTKLIDELVLIHENVGIKVDIMEALPKCVFSQKARDSKLSFLRRQCQAGRSVISVSPTGEVRPCSHNPDSYGNLNHEDLATVWSSMAIWRSHSMVPVICTECKMIAKCLGGCRINAKVANNQLSDPDPLCTGPVDFFESRPHNQIVIGQNTVIRCPRKLRWRHEGDGAYLIFGDNPHSTTCVSQELYEFVIALRQHPIWRFQEIIDSFEIEDSVQLQGILQRLVSRQVLSIGK